MTFEEWAIKNAIGPAAGCRTMMELAWASGRAALVLDQAIQRASNVYALITPGGKVYTSTSVIGVSRAEQEARIGPKVMAERMAAMIEELKNDPDPLLIKYIAHVIYCEGADYIDPKGSHSSVLFSPEEWAELEVAQKKAMTLRDDIEASRQAGDAP